MTEVLRGIEAIEEQIVSNAYTGRGPRKTLQEIADMTGFTVAEIKKKAIELKISPRFDLRYNEYTYTEGQQHRICRSLDESFFVEINKTLSELRAMSRMCPENSLSTPLNTGRILTPVRISVSLGYRWEPMHHVHA